MFCWRKNKRIQSFTLLELLVVMSIGSVISMIIIEFFLHLHKSYLTSCELHNLRIEQYLTLRTIADELRQAEPNTLSSIPPEGISQISFQKRLDFSSDAVTLSSPIVFRFQLASGEIDDNIDNDGNGLIDDGLVVRQEGPPENLQESTLSFRVHKNGFLFYRSGNSITISLTRSNTVGEESWTLTSQINVLLRD